MSTTLSKAAILVCMAGALLPAQESMYTPPASIKVDLPKDSPLALLSSESGESTSAARGGALILDLHLALSFQNTTQRRVRGVTLLVLAQDVTPGGKASVTVPSLNVSPGESFPVRVDVRLLQPLVRSGVPLVHVGLDGVLFDDLSFYGPDKLNSRRSMTVWEMEARHDRDYFRKALEAKGPEGLRQEMLGAMAQQAKRRSVSVRMSGRATATEPEQQVQFAFLNMPGAPVEPLKGLARIAGNEARQPQLEVVNRSRQPVRYFEIGWIIRDRQGQEFLAGVVPSSDRNLALEPGKTAVAAQQKSLQFSARNGEPVDIQGMTGYVSLVEFSDGKLWIPDRGALHESRLRDVVGPSAEEERLVELYKRKGINGLVAELKKFE